MSSDLVSFKNILNQTRKETTFENEVFKFQVIGIYCYLADASYLSSLLPCHTPNANGVIYFYDIIITDQQYKQKCFLNPRLSDLIQRGILQIGHQVKIKKAICSHYEIENGFPYIILSDFSIEDKTEILSLSNLSFMTSHNNRETFPVPLLTCRRYYVNTWLMDIPYMPHKCDDPPKYHKTICKLDQEIISLHELSKEWKTAIRPYPPLLVSVIQQGKLHHYGKNSKNNAFPFQGYLEVADETGIVSAVLWDYININLFSHIKPGTIILIQNYNVVNKYPRSYSSVLRNKLKKLEKYPIELKVNPNGSIHIVERCFIKELLKTKVRFPVPEYWFATRNILGNLLPETNVDIIGLIVYVGCYLREQCLDIYGNPKGTFWTYRWLELVDSTSSLPIVLQVYINDQLDIHNELRPGQILMCSQLRMIYVPLLITKSSQRRDFYLTTTSESRLNICKENEFKQIKEFLLLIDMLKNSDIMKQLETSVYRMGGIYNYPPCQKSFELFKASIPNERLNFLNPSLTWKKELNSLAYKEHRRIIIMGYIIQVIYFSYLENGWIENIDNQIPKVIFIDILRQHCCKYEVLGDHMLQSDAFFHHYSPKYDKTLKNWLSFTPFSAEQNIDENWKEEIKNIPLYYPGYYKIDIASIDSGLIINSFMFLESSKPPHPSFLELLSGNFSTESRKFYGLYCNNNETKNQFDNIKKTVHNVSGKKMLCILDLYNNSPGNVNILLKRAFPFEEQNDYSAENTMNLT